MRRLGAIVLACALAGCGGGDDDDMPAVDGGGTTVDGGTATADADTTVVDAALPTADANLAVPDAAICSTLATSVTVTGVAATGTAPTPAGGTIAAGTYVLMTAERFGGTGTVGTFRETIRFGTGATSYERAIRVPGSAEDSVTTGTASTSGTTLMLVDTCGGRGMPNIPYTSVSATGTLKFIQGFAGATFVFTYQKQ